MNDLHFAVRMLRKSPGFTALVVFMFALGIGANTAIFSFVDHLVFHPLPLPDVERLMWVGETDQARRGGGGPGRLRVSPANFRDWKEQASTFENLSAWMWWMPFLSGESHAEAVRGCLVTPDFFDTIGVKPAQGSAFRKNSDTPGNDQVIVLSHGLWQRRFGGDSKLPVGRRLRFANAQSVGDWISVVGVVADARPRQWGSEPNVVYLAATQEPGQMMAIALSWVLSNQVGAPINLFQIDPMAISAVVAILVAVALLASYLPARRAARVDPMAALRCE